MQLTHLALHLRDLTAGIAFYERYCGMSVVRDRRPGSEVVWLSEPGREQDFIFVLLGGGPGRVSQEGEFGHLGFAVDSRAEVDAIAARAEAEGCLLWPPREEPWPVGYYCGVIDPDGNYVEFSHGQPLGPGAPSLDPPP